MEATMLLVITTWRTIDIRKWQKEATRAADQPSKFNACKDFCRSVMPLLLYPLNASNDTFAAWKSCQVNFKKTWTNKLQLRKTLYSTTLKECNSVQQHLQKLMKTDGCKTRAPLATVLRATQNKPCVFSIGQETYMIPLAKILAMSPSPAKEFVKPDHTDAVLDCQKLPFITTSSPDHGFSPP